MCKLWLKLREGLCGFIDFIDFTLVSASLIQKWDGCYSSSARCVKPAGDGRRRIGMIFGLISASLQLLLSQQQQQQHTLNTHPVSACLHRLDPGVVCCTVQSVALHVLLVVVFCFFSATHPDLLVEVVFSNKADFLG